MRITWRRCLLGLAALAAVAFGPAPANAQGCGDVNNSGALNAPDCQLLARVAVGLQNPATLCNGMGAASCGDMDGNGSIGLADALVCLRVLNNLPTLFTPCTGPGNNVACGSTRSGNINTNETWLDCPGTSITITGPTFVQPGVTITIQPGALIEATPGATAFIVFQRDSRINANGTAANPIVFTSNSPPKSTGDWGGLVINGRAQANCGGSCFSEGFDPMSAPLFGGTNDNDTSGILRFVRVEFSGITFSPDNELNVLTLNGVGRSTQMDHVQTHRGDDDCFEWFGGAVDGKFLVASGCLDDLVDWQLGWRGRVQHVLAIQALTGLDNGDRHAIEADNNETVQSASPFSEPKVCNLTAVGTKNEGGVAGGKEGARLRRTTGGIVANSVFTDFERSGLRIQDTGTCANIWTSVPTCSSANLKSTSPFLSVQNTFLFDNGPGATGTVNVEDSSCGACDPQADWTAARGLQANVDPQYNTTNPVYPAGPGLGAPGADRYVPTAASPAATAGADCQLVDPAFFDSATYAGAFDPDNTPATTNWLRVSSGWINFDLN